MRISPFFKFFPPPTYLSMPAAGLDISDQSVKCVRISVEHGTTRVSCLGERKIPTGTLEAGKIKDPATLTEVLRSLTEEFKLDYVVASLPEQQTYVVQMTLPAMAEGELRGAIELQLEQYVPLPPAELIFDFEILKRPTLPTDSYEVGVSILPRAMVGAYLDVFGAVGLTPLALELESKALGRALIPTGSASTFMIVDMGKIRTSFSVIREGVTVFTSSLTNMGGETITKNIEKSLHISYEEAEQQKSEKGLHRTADADELFSALVPVLSSLRDEIARLHEYWNTHAVGALHDRYKIEAIILCGGQATMPGLVAYLAADNDVPVKLGNPWANVFSFEEVIPPLAIDQALRYATVLGLALRNVERINLHRHD